MIYTATVQLVVRIAIPVMILSGYNRNTASGAVPPSLREKKIGCVPGVDQREEIRRIKNTDTFTVYKNKERKNTNVRMQGLPTFVRMQIYGRR